MDAGVDLVVAGYQALGTVDTPLQQSLGAVQVKVLLQGALQVLGRGHTTGAGDISKD